MTSINALQWVLDPLGDLCEEALEAKYFKPPRRARPVEEVFSDFHYRYTWPYSSIAPVHRQGELCKILIESDGMCLVQFQKDNHFAIAPRRSLRRCKYTRKAKTQEAA